MLDFIRGKLSGFCFHSVGADRNICEADARHLNILSSASALLDRKVNCMLRADEQMKPQKPVVQRGTFMRG